MKSSTRYLSLLLCFATAGSLALAADADAPKELRVVAGPGADGPKTTVTFLGVETGPTSRTLTEQLGLAPETGLVVNGIAPESAAAAVLKVHDILMKLDDQKLIESRQLAVLIRSHREGDEVTLTYLRGGKEATAKVKLGKHDLPDLHDLHKGSWESGGPAHQPWQNFSPDSEHLRRLGEESGMPQEEVDRILPLMREGRDLHMRVIHPSPDGAGGEEVTTVNTSNGNLVLTDDVGTLEVKVTDGKKQVVAKNAKGEVIFSGPYNTEAERKAAPPEVRQRLDKLERMEGVRFKADADFHPGESDVVVPAAHRILFRQTRRPADLPPPAPML